MKKCRKLMLLVTLIIALSSSVFGYRVLADSDKTTLIEVFTEVQTAISNQDGSTVEDPYYKTDSYQAFTDSIDLLGGSVGIQAVIDDALADQTTVDQYTADISDALDGLILDDTYNAVLAEFIAADSISLVSYTTDSQTLYKAELDRIESILNTATSGEVAIQALSQEIVIANDLLVLIGNKQNLEVLNQLLIDAYYEDSILYTDSSHEAFRDACALFGSYLYVNTIIASTNVSQTEVDTLEAQIENALDLLVFIIDNSDLIAVYYQLSGTDLSTYTQDSRDAYNAELDRLYRIIIGNELDADTAIGVLYDLSIIDSLLVYLSDYSELQDLYDSLDVYREEDYSVSSYASFTEAKQNASDTLSDLNATQEEIAAAILYLESTIDELDISLETVYILESETFDVADYITLGQATIVGYTIDDESIIDINDTGIVEGLTYGRTTISVTLSNGAVEVIEVFVTAKLTTSTYILIFSVPTACLGLAALLVYGKKDIWIRFGKTIAGVFKKK